jgi:hypothetical protein
MTVRPPGGWPSWPCPRVPGCGSGRRPAGIASGQLGQRPPGVQALLVGLRQLDLVLPGQQRGGAQPDPGTGGTDPTRPYGARALQRSSPSSRPPSTPARAHPTRPRARASAVPPLTPHLAAMSGSSRRPRRGRPRSRRPGRAAPAHRAVPDEVVEAVAQRHRRRQVGEPVEGSALVLLHLPSRLALALRLPALYGRTVGQESREGGTGRGIFSAMRPAVVHQRGSGRFGCRLRQ